jgi:hypothetical protein
MNEALDDLRQTCRGVLGSFLLDNNGNLLLKDLPRLLSTCDPQKVGRLFRDVYRQLDDSLPRNARQLHCFEDIIVKFDSWYLYCRSTGEETPGFLVMILEHEVDLTKVKGFSNLAINKLRDSWPNGSGI